MHADLSADEFEKIWAELPVWQRWLVGVLSPVMALRLRWFGTRELIAGRLGMDDAMSRDELLRWSPDTALFGRVMLDVRDARLIEVLGEQLVTRDSVAVVFGAAHMRAVLRELMGRREFTYVEAEWMLVFAFQ